MSSFDSGESRQGGRDPIQREFQQAEEPQKDAFTILEPAEPQKASRIRPLSSAKPSFSETKTVAVAVDQMPIPDFVHYLFSDIFGVNYVMDNKIKSMQVPVTLNLTEKISESHLFKLASELLKQHGISIYSKDNVYYIWAETKGKEVAVGIGESIDDIPATAGEVQQIVPIRYMDAQNLVNFLPPVPGAKVAAAAGENVVVVSGSREQVEQIVKSISVLDRPAMRGRYVGTVRLTYWNPPEMIKKLSEILGEEGIPVAERAGQKGLYFTALERWGAVLLFASEKEWLERARYWIKVLDVPYSREGRQFFLYYPQNSKASELGEVLRKILGLKGAEGAPRAEGKPAVEAQMGVRAGEKGGVKEVPAAADMGRQLGAVAGDVGLTVDETRNVLIIFAASGTYETLEALLQRLDVMPVQVLLETTVAEVTLRDSLQYGLEWFLRNTSGSQTTILQTLGGLGLGSGGLNLATITDSEKFRMLINALAQENLLKILSAPKLTVRDGKSASIVIGTEVPILTATTTTSEVPGQIVQSIQYRNTGVQLRVTPSVHAEGVVTLLVSQEVSEAQTNNTSSIDSPIILNRTINTEVVAGDKQTILIGGLIQENKSDTVNKVPLLGDIPLLGFFFKTTSKGVNRTELVVMITPHIIRDTKQMEEMRDAIVKSFDRIEGKM
jgi:general secretion pathway protein D